MTPYAYVKSEDSILLRNRLVAGYAAALIARPLLTKCYTSGVLCFIQEVLANHLAGVPFPVPPDAKFHTRVLAALKLDIKAVKMAVYGFFVSAPLNHYLNGVVERIFAGHTSRKAKFGRLLAFSFFVAPITTFVYLAATAIINGARTKDEIMVRVRRGYSKMLAITWFVQPTAMLSAQLFIPWELWGPFYNMVYFSLGTYFNTKIKAAQLHRLRESRPPCGGCGQCDNCREKLN